MGAKGRWRTLVKESGIRTPNKGDLVCLDLGDSADGEVGKRRPVLVLSETAFNRYRELCIVAPFSTSQYGDATEVQLPGNLEIKGAVMCEHVHTVNWRLRKAERIGRAPPRVVEDVLDRVALILGIERK